MDSLGDRSKASLSTSQSILHNASSELRKTETATDGPRRKLDAQAMHISQLTDTLEAQKERHDGMKTSGESMKSDWDKLLADHKENREKSKKIISAVDEHNRAISDSEAKARNLKERVDSALGTRTDIDRDTKGVRNHATEVQGLASDAAGSISAAKNAEDRTQEKMKTLEEKIEQLRKKIQQAREYANNVRSVRDY